MSGMGGIPVFQGREDVKGEHRPAQTALHAKIANTLHKADCGCGDFRPDGSAHDDPYYSKLADAVLAALDLDARDARVRAEALDEAARAIEVANGRRCPECGGKPASRKYKGLTVLGMCGGGHRWEIRSTQWRSAEDVVRALGASPPSSPVDTPPRPTGTLTIPAHWTRRCGSAGCTGHPDNDGERNET